jgi:hypothetical protein
MSRYTVVAFVGLALALTIGGLASDPTGAGWARLKGKGTLRPDKPGTDPLPSWEDGPAKKAFLEFVRKVTDKDSSDFVAPADRIATFDNDGTLWVEQPIYTQAAFALDRVKALAPQHPDWPDKFVRGFSDRVYGVPIEQVIGSAVRTKYRYNDGRPDLLRLPVLLLLDDEDGKPEDIELFIGKKPLAALGNSIGDRQMLEWTQSEGGTRLMMLVHHDDA